MKLSLRIITFDFFIILLFGCNKATTIPDNSSKSHPCAPTYTNTIDTFLLNSFLFNNGSYWIYLDSLSNSYDSSYLIEPLMPYLTFYEGPFTPGQGQCEYFIKYAYNSTTVSKLQYEYYLQGNNIYVLNQMQSWSNGYFPDFLCYSDNGVLVLGSNNFFYPSYQIDNTTYTNVYKYHFDNSFDQSLPDSGYFYLKAHVGIIKTEFYYSGLKRTYKLIRSHIQ